MLKYIHLVLPAAHLQFPQLQRRQPNPRQQQQSDKFTDRYFITQSRRPSSQRSNRLLLIDWTSFHRAKIVEHVLATNGYFLMILLGRMTALLQPNDAHHINGQFKRKFEKLKRVLIGDPHRADVNFGGSRLILDEVIECVVGAYQYMLELNTVTYHPHSTRHAQTELQYGLFVYLVINELLQSMSPMPQTCHVLPIECFLIIRKLSNFKPQHCLNLFAKASLALTASSNWYHMIWPMLEPTELNRCISTMYTVLATPGSSRASFELRRATMPCSRRNYNKGTSNNSVVQDTV